MTCDFLKRTSKHLLGITSFVALLCAPSQIRADSILPLDFQQASFLTGPIVFDNALVGTMAADLNRDGNSDLIEFFCPPPSTNYSTMKVWLNTGNGNFILTADYHDRYYTGAKIIDLNADQIPDIVCRGAGPPNFDLFGVLLGRGNGTFQPLTDIGGLLDGYILWLQTGDFNGDGKIDLVGILRSDYISSLDTESLAVFLNNGNGGDGEFSQQYHEIDFESSGFPRYFEKGDFDGDGKLDLLIARDYDGIRILLGNGDGSFQVKTNLPGYFDEIFTEDVNADGKTDIVVVDSNIIRVFLADSTGEATFLPAIQNDIQYTVLFGFFPRSGDGTHLSMADFNADGLVDVAYRGTGAIHLLLGNGKGTFVPAESLKLNGNYPFGLALHSYQTNFPNTGTNELTPVYLNAADFNNDTRPDLLVRMSVQNGLITNFFSTLYNTTKPHPRLGSISLNAQGAQMLFFATPGQAYTLQVSTNLLTWNDISTLTNQTGTLQFTDPATTNSTHRFYRARKTD